MSKLKVLFLNVSLKNSSEVSHTEALFEEAKKILKKRE